MLIAGFMLLTFVATPNLVYTASSTESNENFSEAKNIIDQKISCDKLTDGQLEKIGDYYMEQVHPGDAHEQMDEMIGGEESDTLTQMHILMARRWYCQDSVGVGMMGYLNGNANNTQNYSGGMMGGNWNNNQAYSAKTNSNYYPGSMMSYGNIWNSTTLNNILPSILHILTIIFFGFGIAALTKYLLKK